MIISLLVVLACAVSLIFLSMHEVTAQTVTPIMRSFDSVAMFNATTNASALPQDASNFDKWGMVPG